jgi:hypothetical protein
MAAEAQGFQVAPVKTAWPARAAMFKVVDFPRRFAAAFAARVRGDVGVTTAPPPWRVAVATVAPVPVCGTAARPVQQHDRTARFGAQVGRVPCHAQQRAATKSARLCDRLRDLRLVAGAGQNVNDDHSVVALRKVLGASVRLAGVGMMIVFAAAAATEALQALFGIAGPAIALLAFIVLGNPATGVAFSPAMLPGFWRAIGSWLPPGAGVRAETGAVYFQGHATLGALAVLAVYAGAGTAVALVIGGRRRRA